MDINFLKHHYKLKESVINDFKRHSATEEELKFWTNRVNELKKWMDIIEESTRVDKNFLVFIIGSYGRGKTLSLLKIKEEVERNYKNIAFPVYMSFLGEGKSKPGLDFMFRIFKSINFSLLVQNKNYDEIVKSIDGIPDRFDEVKNVLRSIYMYVNLYNQHVGMKNEKTKLALYFLSGDKKLTKTELKKLGVMRSIENIDVAKEYLIGILYFMRNLGFKSLVLAIDEFEYLFSLVPKTKHSVYIALLRGLYDLPVGWDVSEKEIANIVMFIGISEDGWNKLKEIEKKEIMEGGPTRPLMRRIDLETVLDNFNEKETEELIKKVLRYNRITNRFENDPLIPFTRDFVSYIYRITNGLPSAIKIRCSQILDAGLADKIPIIDESYAKKVLEERGFL